MVEDMLSADDVSCSSSQVSAKSEKNMADFDGEESGCEEELVQINSHAELSSHLQQHLPNLASIYHEHLVQGICTWRSRLLVYPHVLKHTAYPATSCMLYLNTCILDYFCKCLNMYFVVYVVCVRTSRVFAYICNYVLSCLHAYLCIYPFIHTCVLNSIPTIVLTYIFNDH